MLTLRVPYILKNSVVLILVFFLQYFIWQKYSAVRIYIRAEKSGVSSGVPELEKESLIFLEKAAQLDPLAPEYPFKSGELFFMQKEYPLARERVSNALFLDPVNGAYHLELARIYAAENNTEKAEEEFRKAVKLDYTNAYFHYELAGFYSSRPGELNNRRSYDEYKKTLFLEAARSQSGLTKNVYSLFEGRYDVLSAIIPNTAQSRYAFADFLMNRGKMESSLKEYKKAVILAHKSGSRDIAADAYNMIGRLYFLENKDLRLSIYYLKVAVKLNSKNAWFISNLGESYLKGGRIEEAKSAFQKAIAIEPTRSASLIGLGRVYEETGAKELARAYYADAIKFATGKYAEPLKKEASDGLARLK